MASNAELRKAIKEMAEELAEGVVKLISTMSLKQLASLTGDGPTLARALAERSEPRSAPKAKAKGKAKPTGLFVRVSEPVPCNGVVWVFLHRLF